ncbi:ICMT-domain-containing protein [Polychaeton citri CBS 116435]|uniref:Protein-S-isoprenylcysteine O-methyltransferase n=1 Tax=Polychaeton citri CBS 116435 TaxID=1314669 RepID=A0A9P4UNL9_9PEZI|nr:ICMT-domain-containing protein [Polychaeton citri CBS 116435]
MSSVASATATAPSANGHAPGPALATSSEPTIGELSFDFDDPRYRQKSQPVPSDPTLLPSGTRSLSYIGLQAFGLGFTLAFSLLAAAWLSLQDKPIWRLPAFLVCLSIFHFLEYWTTARFNLPATRASSFLLFSNGTAYNVAHTAAMVEILFTSLLTPSLLQRPLPSTINATIGLAFVVVGQLVRSVAMAQAGTNFNHTPVKTKKEDHQLVTAGIYGYLRHPSYFGFFWWAIGTQLLVGNKVCLLGYVGILWHFFYKRIIAEEKTLVEFFGRDYEDFRRRTQTGIPFIR